MATMVMNEDNTFTTTVIWNEVNIFAYSSWECESSDSNLDWSVPAVFTGHCNGNEPSLIF